MVLILQIETQWIVLRSSVVAVTTDSARLRLILQFLLGN